MANIFKLCWKTFVISWWCACLGTYAFFLAQVGKQGVMHEWFSYIASFVFTGAGFAHVYNLYKIPTAKFSGDYGWPIFFVTIGVVLLGIGIVCNARYTELWAQILSFGYIAISVFSIVAGADTGPSNQSG